MTKITCPALKLVPSGRVTAIAVSPNQRFLVVTMMNLHTHVIDLVKGKAIHHFENYSNLTGVGFIDDNTIYLADDNFGIQVANTSSNNRRKLRLNLPEEMQNVTDFTCCENYLLMCSRNHFSEKPESYLTVFDTSTSKNPLFSVKNKEGENFRKCTLYRKGNYAAVIAEKTVYKLNIAGQKLVKVLTWDEELIGCCMISSRGMCFWSEKTICVYIDGGNEFEKHFEVKIGAEDRIVAVTRGTAEEMPVWVVLENKKKNKTFVMLTTGGEIENKMKLHEDLGDELTATLWERDFFFFSGNREGLIRQRKLPPTGKKVKEEKTKKPETVKESESESESSEEESEVDEQKPTSSKVKPKREKSADKKKNKKDESKKKDEPEKKKAKK